MIRRTVWMGMGLLLAAAVVAGGDVVILQNGDRIEGEVVSENPSEVVIKRTFRSGIKFTDKIERSKIARIEKSEGGETPSPASVAGSELPHSQPASTRPMLTDADRKRLLSESITHWEKQEYAAAGTLLSRLINATSAGELKELSAEVEKRIELSLGDMAAEAHLQAAIIRSRGSSVVLQYVTEYERPYLVPRLIDAYEEAINNPVSVEPLPVHPSRTRSKTTAKTEPGKGMSKEGVPAGPGSEAPSPASQPAAGPAIAGLLDNPQDFEGDREQAIALSRQIRFALSLLSARMRYDTDYRNKPEVREELLQAKNKLMALQKEITAKVGEATPSKESQERGPAGRPPGPAFRPGENTPEAAGPQGPGGPGEHARRVLRDVGRQQQGEEGANDPLAKENEQ